mmetsp:Transcript_122354/g.238036  ORF Transcript_122354/g.238036 Transcript_122354/m.238036 type:complete len:176 (+) Transcript_122354:45-572(+)
MSRESDARRASLSPWFVAAILGTAAGTAALAWWISTRGKHNRVQNDVAVPSMVVSTGIDTDDAVVPSTFGSVDIDTGPIARGIRSRITANLQPTRLMVRDDSAAHRGHSGVAGARTPETHFHVEVVSPLFERVSKRDRQQQVQDLLREEFAAGLHALELVCRTAGEDSRVQQKQG